MDRQQELEDGITLLTGNLFSYDDPGAGTVAFEDIVRPLSNVCRFAGQLPYFYSVAQHLVNTSRVVEPQFAYDALMHDTAEAFTNDIVTPLKRKVELFKILEQRIESNMAQRFGFTYPMLHEVHEADRIMLALEMKYIRGQDPARHSYLNGVDYEPHKHKVDLTSWDAETAYHRFKERFYELMGYNDLALDEALEEAEPVPAGNGGRA